jgi:O-antigen/teichoic acid export membrane protein
MDNIKIFISNFLGRSGNHVILATVLSRIFSFIASWIALQLIPNKEFGIVLFSYNIILFILPLSGLGLYQSLIRYAPFLTVKKEKNKLFNYVLIKGIRVNSIIITCIIIIAILIPFENTHTKYYLIILSLTLFPEYIVQILKIQFRVMHENKKFSQLEVFYNIILILFISVFSFYLKEKGYVIALLLTPVFTSLFYLNKLTFRKCNKPSIVDLKFWKYGFFAGLTSVVSQLLVSIDILLIGIILVDSNKITDYRYISIIPMSMLFLSNSFMSTDFVTLTERIYNKKYIFNYIKNYSFIFSIISIILLLISYFFGGEILSFFDQNYIVYSDSFFVLTLGISSVLILRGLFGNLLSSIGKVNSNLFIVIIAVILNILGNYKLIPEFGIYGAAITSSFIMWFSSIASLLVFLYHYNKLLKNKTPRA